MDQRGPKHCVECGEHLLAEELFCDRCGTSAPQPCDQCGGFNAANAKFCGACGDRLSTPVALGDNNNAPKSTNFPLALTQPLLAERKFVTVLVVDMVESLAAIREADPEEAHDIFSFGISIMTDAIHDFGGSIFANTGDGVLAMFGAPNAQSDHPIRCCYAALKILQRLTEARKTKSVLDVRMGVHSGEVAFGMTRTDLAMNYDLTGLTVHIASRLQNKAPRGGVVMSAASKALIGDGFETECLGMTEIRGLSKQIELFELGKPRARTALESRELNSIFVGRTEETNLIEVALDRAIEGAGSSILIEGEAGIGKTHLIDRFLADNSASMRVSRIVIDRYRDNGPFYAVRSILLDLFGLTQIAPHERLSKVAEISDAAGDKRSVTEAALCELFELESGSGEWADQDARTRNRLISDVVIDQLMKLAQTQTHVVIIEDIQWMDSCSLDVVGRFIDAIEVASSLLIMTCRPETRLKWRNAPGLRHVVLSGLTDTDIEDLTNQIMSGSATPTLCKQLVTWSHGNPLFLCELVRTLMESEVFRASPRAKTLEQNGFEPPESVRGIVAERIDRLSSDLKEMLLAASVLGDSFDPELLGAITDAPRDEVILSLKRLEAFDFVREVSEGGRVDFTFRHPLFQEVSYATVLKKKRVQLHASAYQEISAPIFGVRAPPVERLAHHAFNGALWAEAAKNCHAAGKKALDTLAAREASLHLHNALEAIGRLEENSDGLATGIDIRLKLRTALVQLLRLSQAEDLVTEAHQISVRLGDQKLIAETAGLKALHEYLQRGPATAKELATKSIALALALNDKTMVVAPSICLAQSHYALGQFEETISVIQGIMPTINEFEDLSRVGLPTSPAINAWYWAAISTAELGEFDAAHAYLAKMKSHRSDINALDRVFNDTARGFVLMAQGDFAAARDASLKAWELSEKADVPYLTPVLASQVGLLLAKTGDTSQAIQFGERAVETALEIGVFAGRSRWCARLAEIYLIANRMDEARKNIDIAIDVSESAGELCYLASGLQLRARFTRELGESPETAYSDLKQAILITRRLKVKPTYARCLLELSLLERDQQNLTSARRKMLNAARHFEHLGMTEWIKRVEFEQEMKINLLRRLPTASKMGQSTMQNMM